MPTHVANPQTEAQQSHRSNFAIISKLSSYMKEAHLVGLHWHAVREHNSTYALFRQLNKDCFTADGDIDFPRVIVSKGSVPEVAITSAGIADGVLTVTFDSRPYGGTATDEFYLFVYCPALCTGRLATPIPRSAGKLTAVLPAEWLQATPATAPEETNTLTPARPQGVALSTAELNQISEKSRNHTFHLYAFLRSTRGRTSDTIYYSLVI